MMATAPSGVPLAQGIWIGAELVLHRPNYETNRGTIDAAYNPVSNTWRRLPSSTYLTAPTEGGTQAVWSGTELLTFGVHNGALNPATGRWRPLAAPPFGGASVVVWTGSAVLIWGGGCCDEALNVGASYDPGSNSWTAIPAGPLAGRRASGVWTGSELVVVGGQAHWDTFFRDAAAYNPATRTWRQLPAMPSPRFDASVTWTGSEVMVVGGLAGNEPAPSAEGLAYNPATNTWRQLGPMPMGRTGHTAVWTGHYLLVWGGQTRTAGSLTYSAPPNGLVYDPVSGRWSNLPKAPIKARVGAVACWTGDRMIIWGGRSAVEPYVQFVDGATYTP
jgi:N-acetylneuraminic acid mutarotase